jgi:site-specific recombinase XerD
LALAGGGERAGGIGIISRCGVTLFFPAAGEDRKMDVLYGVRMAGPLAPYARGLVGELARLGFTELSARGQLGLAAHLSRWLDAAGLGTAELTGATVEAYLASRRASGYTAYLTPKALAPLLGYLRALGVAPDAELAAPRDRAEELLERYRCYLLGERGLQVKVARGYLDMVRPFVARCVTGGSADPGRLAAGDVTAFLTAESRRLAPKTAQRLATALRSLLRFWHVEGLISEPLDRAVPKVANRRPALPRGLEPAQVQAMLASCDRQTAAGRRDLAMLVLLARMGLRAGEVAGLGLDDIDWRCGEITIRGKGGRRDRLPLPADAGEAIAEWLQHGRPSTALDRSVFTRIKAPHQGLTSGGVTQAVAAAARRAGLGTIYAHRLRHSAATAMLAGGGSLAEIGQVLRHRRPQTTAAYTKVNVEALRALARPWPGAS